MFSQTKSETAEEAVDAKKKMLGANPRPQRSAKPKRKMFGGKIADENQGFNASRGHRFRYTEDYRHPFSCHATPSRVQSYHAPKLETVNK